MHRGNCGPGGFAFCGRMRNEQIRGQFSATLAGSALDAAPFSLTGAPTEKPDYFQQRYTLTLGGPVKIPAINKGSSRTTFFMGGVASRFVHCIDRRALGHVRVHPHLVDLGLVHEEPELIEVAVHQRIAHLEDHVI